MSSKKAVLLIVVTIILAGLWQIGTAAWGAQAVPTETRTVFLPAVMKKFPPVIDILAKIQLPSGSHPHGIDLDIAGQRAFVGNHQANTLSVLDTASMTVAATIALPGADGPNGVAYHPGLDRVYVTNRNTENISIVDPSGGSVIGNRSVGSLPDGVAVAGDVVYVANFGSDSVSILDAQTNVVTRTLALGDEPSLMATNDETGVVYLASHGNHTIYYLRDGNYYGSHPFGVTEPYGLGFDSITYRLYAANRGSNRTVTMIDVNPNLWMGTFDVGQEPFVVGVNPRTGHVFVVCGDVVKVYDRRDNALLTTLPVSSGAEEGIAVDPSRNLVYVTNSDTDQVTVIQDVPAYDIAFVSWRDGLGGIFVIDDTGQHVQRLTVLAEAISTQPAWRPDGRQLAFVSNRDPNPYPNPNGYSDILTMEVGGQNQINLTNDATDDREPAWSPDGSRIAWHCGDSICVMNANGNNRIELASGLGGRLPQWSPNGQWLAFGAFAGLHEDVFFVPATGGTPINLTNNPAVDLGPSWSADSSEIVFETNRHSVMSGTLEIENWELYKVNLNTLVQTRLTNDPAQDHAAAWSPNGTRIAFVSDRENSQYDYSLYVMNGDGTSQRRLTDPMDFVGPLAWSPDSRRLVAQSGLVDNGEIYTVDAETGALTRLTFNAVFDTMPVWRPDTWGGNP